jgi:hypothetical protein
MYEIIKIKENNKFLLDDFLKNKIPTTFRYFTKRDSTIIKNHILTLVLMTENKPIGYAHIDNENNKYWLGICIIDEYQNKGYGKILINYILNDENVKKNDIFFIICFLFLSVLVFIIIGIFIAMSGTGIFFSIILTLVLHIGQVELFLNHSSIQSL